MIAALILMPEKTKTGSSLKIVIVALLLIGGIVFYIYNLLNNSLSRVVPAVSILPLTLTASVSANGSALYNNSALVAPYALINYSTQNSNNLSMIVSTYQRNPLPRIYFLNTTNLCYRCINQFALSFNLSSSLNRYGLLPNSSSFSMVNLSSLRSVPSGSIIIIDSGLMPVYLIPKSGLQINGSTITDLLNNQDTIIYVGGNFSSSLGVGLNNQLITYQTSPLALAILSNSSLGTTAYATNTLNRLGLSFSNSTFSFMLGQYSKPLTYVTVGNGTLIAFPNNEQNGWPNLNPALRSMIVAGDIAKLINSRLWLKSLAQGSYTLNPGGSAAGNIGVMETNTSLRTSQNSFGSLNNLYSLATITSYNSTTFIEKNIPFRFRFAYSSSMSMQSVIGASQNASISITPATNASAKSLYLVMNLYTQNLTFVLPQILIGTFSNIPHQTITIHHEFDLPPGNYIAVLTDINNKTYAKTLFQVANVSISLLNYDFKNGTFVFRLNSNNLSVANAPYTIDLDGNYRTNSTVSNSSIYYTLPKGTILDYGTKTFNINMFNTRYAYKTSYSQQIFSIPTIYIELAVVVMAVVILNIIVKEPNKDEYYIDVPDFLPTKKGSVSVDKNAMLSVFDKVNYYYHWKYMPLSVEEVKNGINQNIRSNNIPISVTLQNVDMVLTKLGNGGDVVSSNGYYAPKKWVGDSTHDIEYLTIFRKFRDYCVSHAMLFTEIGTSDIADIILTKAGTQTYVDIYSSVSGLREIKLAEDSKVYIAFIDEETRLDFMDKLYKSYGDQAEILKIGITYNYIKLIDTNNLDQMTI